MQLILYEIYSYYSPMQKCIAKFEVLYPQAYEPPAIECGDISLKCLSLISARTVMSMYIHLFGCCRKWKEFHPTSSEGSLEAAAGLGYPLPRQ